jgi:diguanylate cyclase (GGDEF)-like protein
MRPNPRRWLRRHRSLLVSGGLVLVIGAGGVLAGQAAGQQAREVHRADRLALQETLTGLTEQYVLLSAADLMDTLAAQGPWSSRPRDPATEARLEELVTDVRSIDVGAVLVGPTGAPIASWSTDGVLPAADDPGWGPLRTTVLTGGGKVLPVSGALATTSGPRLAMGLPVALSDGQRGLLLGLWDPRESPLQRYVSELEYGETGHGYIVDAAGIVLAGPDTGLIGAPLPLPGVRSALVGEGPAILDTADRGGLVTSYARAGQLPWTALTPQSRDEFEGALVRSSRLVQGAVLALLLCAGTGLVVLHRKREKALQIVALRDELTGLYNRRGWFVLAEHELERARRQNSPRVLLFVDVDGLKQVNDVLGHREGDRAIGDAARVLTAASRSSDLVGRLGGDEFVLLLGDDGKAEAARRRVADALATHNEKSSAGFELRMSIGAEVWFPDQACTLAELVRRADEEMYADKTSRPLRHDGVLRVPLPASGGGAPEQVTSSAPAAGEPASDPACAADPPGRR